MSPPRANRAGCPAPATNVRCERSSWRATLKIVILLLVLMAGSGGCGPARKSPFSFASQVGVAYSKQGQTCLAIRNPALTAGTSLSLALLAGPRATASARVVANGCPGATALGEDVRSYSVKLQDEAAAAFLPAVAVLGPAVVFSRIGDGATAELNRDGKQELIRACTSSEGVHFTIWPGAPLRGRPLWHQYLYLGYDVESSCTAAEVESVRP